VIIYKVQKKGERVSKKGDVGGWTEKGSRERGEWAKIKCDVVGKGRGR